MDDLPQAVTYSHGLGEGLVRGLISSYHPDGTQDSYDFLAWKSTRPESLNWSEGRGQMPVSKCSPHPDPDGAWARYTAWKLTQ